MVHIKWNVWHQTMVWDDTTKPEEINGSLSFKTKEGNEVRVSKPWGYIKQEVDDGN